MQTRASLIIRLGIGLLMSSLLVGNAAAKSADHLNTEANTVLECVP